MSNDPQAKLFYGYLGPKEDDGDWGNDEDLEEEADHDPEAAERLAWRNTHIERAEGCIGGIYGYDENLGYFLAVEEALHTVEWNETESLSQDAFTVKPEWNNQLAAAAAHFGLDVSKMQPGWYLACLYF